MTSKTKAVRAITLIVTLLNLLSIPGVAQGKSPISDKAITFTDRLRPSEVSPRTSPFMVPSGRVLVITDVVIQNRAPGDEPVDPSQFSRVVLGQFLTVNEPTGQEIFYTVVGNDTLNIHFTTGLQVSHRFRVYNVVNSSAAFIEFTITGFLE
jgi:hypothetical protein